MDWSPPPSLYPADVRFDPIKLHEEFAGPLATLPPAAAKDVHFTVGRLTPKTASSFSTLAEAIAVAPQGKRTIITVVDNGPLFVPELPPLTDRSLVIQGDGEHRPLVIWEPTTDKAAALLSVEGGNLTLLGLEFAVRWPGLGGGDEAAAFVRVSGGDFAAYHCTFSAAGKHPHGLVVARLDADKEPARCRLGRCFSRGGRLMVLRLSGKGWDVQVDDSLLAAGSATLIESACPPQAPLTVRVLRSTLVTGKHFLQIETPADSYLKAAVQVKVLDAILAHSDPDSEGWLLTATGKLNTTGMHWRAVNAVYAGWDKLLASASDSILSTDLAAWRTLWQHDDGEKVVLHAWPKNLPADLEEVPDTQFFPKGSPVFVGAVSHDGILGAPHTLAKWLTKRSSWQPSMEGRSDWPPGLYSGGARCLNFAGT